MIEVSRVCMHLFKQVGPNSYRLSTLDRVELLSEREVAIALPIDFEEVI